MNFLNRLGIGTGAAVSPTREVARSIGPTGGRPRTPGAGTSGAVVAAAAARSPDPRESNRVSNGLKELLWNLDGLGRGSLLDLGPAWQTAKGLEPPERESAKPACLPSDPLLPLRLRCSLSSGGSDNDRGLFHQLFQCQPPPGLRREPQVSASLTFLEEEDGSLE